MIKNTSASQAVSGSISTSFLDSKESRVRNDRQTVFSLTRELVHAQFEIADQELTRRLWQEVAERNLDIDRIINLMYGSTSYDDEAMLMADLAYQN